MKRERLEDIMRECIFEDDFTQNLNGTERAADLILSELAAEKPTASGELVEELRGLVKHPKTPITVEDMDDKTWGYINGQKSVYDMFFDRINEILSRYKARKEIVLTEGEMKRDELEALYSLYHGFSRRVNAALKPAVKMWQKSHGQPLTWPDPIALIKWLIKEAK